MATIAVIGGTGYAGSTIVREAVSRGHHVTSLSRSLPAERVEGARYEQGSASDAARAVEGSDVVVGALSPRAGSEGTLVAAYSDLARLAAASGARLIVVGGFSALRPSPGAPRFIEGDVPEEFRPEAAEMAEVLTALQAGPAGLDWLFVSPAAEYGAYAPGQALGTYRVGDDVALLDDGGTSAISGADFALAVVDEIERPRHHRAHIGVAY